MGDVEFGLNLGAPCTAHLGAKRRVRHQPIQRRGQRVHIAGWDHVTAGAVLDQFLHAAHLSGDHRNTCGHRLHQYNGHTFGEAGQDQHVMGIKQGGHLILRFVANKFGR